MIISRASLMLSLKKREKKQPFALEIYVVISLNKITHTHSLFSNALHLHSYKMICRKEKKHIK